MRNLEKKQEERTNIPRSTRLRPAKKIKKTASPTVFGITTDILPFVMGEIPKITQGHGYRTTATYSTGKQFSETTMRMLATSGPAIRALSDRMEAITSATDIQALLAKARLATSRGSAAEYLKALQLNQKVVDLQLAAAGPEAAPRELGRLLLKRNQIQKQINTITTKQTDNLINLMAGGNARLTLTLDRAMAINQKQVDAAKAFATVHYQDPEKRAEVIAAIERARDLFNRKASYLARFQNLRARLTEQQALPELVRRIEDVKLRLNDTTFGEGFRIGLSRSTRQMETFAQTGARIAQITSTQMGSTFETFFFDLMEGRLKSLDQYFKGFFSAVGAAIMRLAAQQTAQLVVSSVTSLFAA